MRMRACAGSGQWGVGVAAVLVLGGALSAGCKGSDDGPGATDGLPGEVPDGGATTRTLRFLSVPNNAALVGAPSKYRPAVSEPGVSVTLSRGPGGAAVDSSGTVVWTPMQDQGGPQTFEVTAVARGVVLKQEYVVKAARPVVQAEVEVDPASPNVTAVVVDAPLSPVRGTALLVPPGAMAKGMKKVTISSLDDPPVPMRARVAQVPSNALVAVELGPTGTVFKSPVRLQLPATPMVLAKGRPRVVTYDYDKGTWTDLPVLGVHEPTGTVMAETTHFSTFMVVPGTPLLAPALALGGAFTACADGVIARTPLALALSSIPSDAVNGWSGAAGTVSDVLAGLAPGQALQAYYTIEARSAAGGSDKGFLLASAAKGVDGTFTVHVTSDKRSTPILTPLTGVAAADAGLVDTLSARRAHFILTSLGDLTGGVSATASLSFFVVPAADADVAPIELVNSVASEDVAAAVLVADAPLSAGFDADCDQAPNAWDATPNGTPPPRLVPMPASPLRVVVGAPVALSVTTASVETAVTWSADDPSVNLAPSGSMATLRPAATGTFRVHATSRLGDVESRVSWDVTVEAPATAASNTPPSVEVSASALQARAGETILLKAQGLDAEQTQLSYAWSVMAPGTLSALAGSQVSFKATTPGTYTVGCVANDGLLASGSATVTLTILEATANRAPAPPVVTPGSASLVRMPNQAVSVVLTAASIDPDGEVVTFTFEPATAWPAGVALAPMGDKAVFSSSVDGAFTLWVAARDSQGATSPATPVKIQVTPPLPPAPVDADGDGFPAGSDCLDTDPSTYPGAKEICGDGRDQDCDGIVDEGCMAPVVDAAVPLDGGGSADAGAPMDAPMLPEADGGTGTNVRMLTTCSSASGPLCTDLMLDRLNCGMCGVACAADQYCDRGLCTGNRTDPGMAQDGGVAPAGCPPDRPDMCTDGQNNPYCTSLASDNLSCGVCGMACGAGTACVAGACQVIAPGCSVLEPTTCPSAGGPTCTNLSSDSNNCGGCGMPCPAGVGCLSGVCQGGSAMPPPTMESFCPPDMPNACVDANGMLKGCYNLLYDWGHCGSCGNACPAGKGCQAGVCVENPMPPSPDPVPCPASLPTACQRQGYPFYCANTQNDAANCGACGKACSHGSTCVQGMCQVVCPQGDIACLAPHSPAGATCFDPLVDNANCGGCGRMCPWDRHCMAGTCAPVDAGCFQGAPNACSTENGTTCVDFRWDPHNCGSCGKACEAGGSCQEGQCVSPPPPPTVQCPPDQPNACPGPDGRWQGCTNLLYDPGNCGGCGIVCGGSDTCVMGVCGPGPAPPPGTPPMSCPAAASTMCSPAGAPAYCANTGTDLANCGACDKPCPHESQCTNGSCQLACPMPLEACPMPQAMGGQACVDVTVDNANCGMCGNACGQGTYCKAGACAPLDPGCYATFPTLCPSPGGGSYCVDLRYNRAHCGVCGMACAGDESCQQGKCVAPPPPPGLDCPAFSPNGCMNQCTDVRTDRYNCGGCGTVCPPGWECFDGACADPIDPPPPSGTCPATAATDCGGFCANLQYDTANCGECGRGCPFEATCQMGTCVGGIMNPDPMPGTDPYQCPTTAFMDCKTANNQPHCVDGRNDPANCGACGNVCPAGVTCAFGQCGGIQCPPDLSLCTLAGDPMFEKGQCVDLKRDPSHCGTCGKVCDAGTYCVAGACQATGASVPGVAACTGSNGAPLCADLENDSLNCGGCGIVCPASTTCQGGRCVDPLQCPPLTMTCMLGPDKTFCADIMRDSMNCGECGKVCAAGTFCEQGTCLPGDPMMSECPAPSVSCLSAMGFPYCADLDKDANNCGGCGIVCPVGKTCDQRQCQ